MMTGQTADGVDGSHRLIGGRDGFVRHEEFGIVCPMAALRELADRAIDDRARKTRKVEAPLQIGGAEHRDFIDTDDAVDAAHVANGRVERIDVGRRDFESDVRLRQRVLPR